QNYRYTAFLGPESPLACCVFTGGGAGDVEPQRIGRGPCRWRGISPAWVRSSGDAAGAGKGAQSRSHLAHSEITPGWVSERGTLFLQEFRKWPMERHFVRDGGRSGCSARGRARHHRNKLG